MGESVNAADLSAIAYVSCLRHRVGTQRTCRCEECRALVRVCALAREAVQMKQAKRRKRQAERHLVSSDEHKESLNSSTLMVTT